MTLSQRKVTAANTGPLHVGLLVVLAALLFALFAALGTWQITRLFWKLDLISQVNQRVSVREVAAPTAAQWPLLKASNDEYRRIRITGTFIAGQDTLVQAVTERGGGFWVLTPLRLADGTVVMVNRGFIPANAAQAITPAAANTQNLSSVTGLLRMTQPGGGFLRKNDPANRRWYSRDVQAIAQALGLTQVAPYFVDADASASALAKNPQTSALVEPVGGLTIISFNNSHLVYALTWYALAAMVAGAAWYFSSAERRLRYSQTADGIDRTADN